MPEKKEEEKREKEKEGEIAKTTWKDRACKYEV